MLNRRIKHTRFTAVILTAVAVCMLPVEAQDRKEVRPTPPVGSAADWNRNGISVGRPKVFDNRSLTIMLESLSETLRNMQFMDAKSVSAALGNFQGSRVTNSSFAASVTGSATPGISDVNTVGTAPGQITTKTTDASGVVTAVTKNDPTATSTTTNDAVTTTHAAQTPTAPTLATPVSDLGVTLPFGQNSSDLLTDQVNLSYQIFNLRMIAERSLSDRLRDHQLRRQAVLGFNVSLDPPSYAKDSAAVVEITIESPGANQGAVSLVAMMPQEKTYNAAALNASSTAFSGAAMAGPVSVGAAGSRSQKTMYLYRDTDTIAYEDMMRGEPNSKLEFGWVFRPVLGRRSVSPGMRQMFAVVALPNCNPAPTKTPEEKKVQEARCAAESANLTISVRTYWKKYERGTLTTYSGSQMVGLKVLRNLFGTSTELTAKYMDFATYTNIEVDAPSTTVAQLETRIHQVDWTSTGGKSAVVSLKGKNFYPGTTVIFGGQTFRESTGNLLIKSDELMDILTDTDALAKSDGVVIGRYGYSARIASEGTPQPPKPKKDLIDHVDVGPAQGSFREVDVILAAPCDDLPRNAVSGTPKAPLVLLNGVVYGDRVSPVCNNKTAQLSLWVPDETITGKLVKVQVIYPFHQVSQIVPITPLFQLERVSAESSSFILRAVSYGVLDGCWTLKVGAHHEMNLPNCAAPDPNVEAMGERAVFIKDIVASGTSDKLYTDNYVITRSKGESYKLAVPPAKPETKKPAFAASQSLSIQQHDARWVQVTGTALQGVSSATIAGIAVEIRLLPAKSDADTDKLQINIPRSISRTPGNLDITFYDANKKVIDAVPLIIVCTACKASSK